MMEQNRAIETAHYICRAVATGTCTGEGCPHGKPHELHEEVQPQTCGRIPAEFGNVFCVDTARSPVAVPVMAR